jgi:hypothetical protein
MRCKASAYESGSQPHLESFCAGITIIDFYNLGQQPPSMTINGGATVTLAKCTFKDNSANIRNDTSEYFASEEAMIAQRQGTIIRLKDCRFPVSNVAVRLTSDLTSENQTYGEVLVISDPYDDALIVSYIDEYGDYSDNASSTVDAATVPSARKGIDSTSAWFQRVKNVRFHFAYSLTTFTDVLSVHPPRHSCYLAMCCGVRSHGISAVMSSKS